MTPSPSPSSSTHRADTAPESASTPPVLGVTGAPASGKSTVSGLLAALGCRVIDVDALGHRALALPAVRDAVVQEFGDGVLATDGRLDRRALARLAFADAAVVERLEAHVHPIVLGWIEDEVALPHDASVRAVVIDCALLFESELDRLCDHTIWVDAPREARAARALHDRGWSDDELVRRESHQLPPAEKRARAERVLENDRGEQELEERVCALLDALVPPPSPAGSDPRAGEPGTGTGSGSEA